MNAQSFDSAFPISGSDLFDVFQQALLEYVDLACESIGEPVEGPSVMSLERGLRLTGPIRGFLVLRANRKLGDVLLEKRPDSDSREAVFDYLARLFVEKWVRAKWNLRDFDPIVTELCNPGVWPAGAPQAARALLVEHYPVEIRLWMEIRGGEK
ncbi:MAG: hypothetical protein ACREL1_06775 [bacterium]